MFCLRPGAARTAPAGFDGGCETDREHVVVVIVWGYMKCRLYQQPTPHQAPQDVLLCRSVIKARQPAHLTIYHRTHTYTYTLLSVIVGCKLCHLISLNFILIALARLTDVTVYASFCFVFSCLIFLFNNNTVDVLVHPTTFLRFVAKGSVWTSKKSFAL